MNYSAKIKITEEQIWKLFPVINPKIGREKKNANIKGFVYTFNKYADYFGVDTLLEVRHFITQVGHESDGFNAFEEYASGSTYEGRKDLGNTNKGDGILYKGRGPIQTTGRKNYDVAGDEILKLPFLNSEEKKLFENDGILKNPKLLSDPVWGTLAAFIYWVDKDLNSICVEDNKLVTIKRLVNGKWGNYLYSPIEAISRKVNGGTNGLSERRIIYEKTKTQIK